MPRKKRANKTAEQLYSMFMRAYNFNSTRFDDYAELNAFYELSQHELPQYQLVKPWVYNINAPYATDAINLRVASLQASDYIGELEPLSPEDKDTVEKLNYAYHALWNEANTDKHVSDSVLRCAVVRDAFTHVVFDDESVVGGTSRKRVGRLVPYFLDPASVNIDPSADSLSNADYIVITERMTADKVKDRYPGFDIQEDQFSEFSPSQRGEIYYGTDFTTEQDNVLTRLIFYEKDRTGVYKTVMVEHTIVEPTKKLPIPMYPIAQLRWQKRLKSPYSSSLLDMLLPLQKTVNEIESAIANTALQFSSPSYVLSADAGIDPEDLALTAGTPGAVYVADAGVDIDKVTRPLISERKVDEQLVIIKQELEKTIYKLAGINDEFLGDVGTTGNTREGTKLALQRSQIVEQRFMTNMEEYVEDLARIFVAYISKAYGGESIFVKKDRSNFEEIDVPEVADDFDFNFYIKLDVKTRYSKNEQRNLMKDLFQQQEQYKTPIKGLSFIDVLKTYDVPQIQELVERFERLTNMDASQRAELSVLIVTMGEKYQVPQELMQQALVELITNPEQMVAVEQFMALIEQEKQRETAAIGTVSDAMRQNEMERMIPQEPNPDEPIVKEK